MNTTDNNKMIAEFMGYTQPHPEYPSTTYWYKEGKAPLTILSFDTDWNWLMDVVEKIENFEDENRCAKYNFIIEQSFVEIIDNNNSDTLFFTDNDTKQISVYKAVVEFIKYYNDESKAS